MFSGIDRPPGSDPLDDSNSAESIRLISDFSAKPSHFRTQITPDAFPNLLMESSCVDFLYLLPY